MKPYIFSFLCLLLLFQNFLAKAQLEDYEDFFESIGSYTDERLYSKMMAYQKKDPYFVSVYVQLGEISYNLMRKADPLQDFQTAVFWANTGALYLNLYIHYTKENEARSNREFYRNLSIPKKESKLSNEDIRGFVDKRIKQLEVYRDSLKMVYESLEKSKESYGKCIQYYHKINNSYYNLNEVLLQCDAKITDELNKLKTHFDSTLFYFEEYKARTKTFPLANYNQQYTLKAIKTFRLDGLTNANFLNDKITLWDFGSWTKEFFSIHQSDIVSLQQEIEKTDTKFNDLDYMAGKRAIGPVEALKPIYDEKFLFRLGKYDNNSLVRDLFAYKAQKQKFYSEWLDPLSSPSDSIPGLLPRKTRYLARLAETKTETDSVLTQFKLSATIEKINRFASFFNQAYKGEKGLKAYCDRQYTELGKMLDESFFNLKQYMAKDFTYVPKGSVPYLKDSVPLSPVNQLYQGAYRTSLFAVTPKKAVYLTGLEVAKAGKNPFISYVDKQGAVKWLKPLEKPSKTMAPGDFKASGIFPDKSGCFVLYSLKSADSSSILVRYDSLGTELKRDTLPLNQNPVFFSFDDISQTILLAFHRKDSADTENMETWNVCLLDSSGRFVWNTLFKMDGKLVDIVKTESNFLVIANYRAFSIAGKLQKASPDGTLWGSLMVNMGPSGAIKNSIAIKKKQAFHVSHVFKLSSNSICTIGYKSAPGDRNGDLYFAVLQPDGKIVFTNYK